MYLYELKKIGKKKLMWVMTAVIAGFCIYSVVTSAALRGGFVLDYTDENGIAQSVYINDKDRVDIIQRDVPKLNGK